MQEFTVRVEIIKRPISDFNTDSVPGVDFMRWYNKYAKVKESPDATMVQFEHIMPFTIFNVKQEKFLFYPIEAMESAFSLGKSLTFGIPLFDEISGKPYCIHGNDTEACDGNVLEILFTAEPTAGDKKRYDKARKSNTSKMPIALLNKLKKYFHVG